MAATPLVATLSPAPMGPVAAALTATPSVVAPKRVFLTGNSMTDGVRYIGFTEMLRSTGAAISLGRQTGSGFAQAYNLNLKPGYNTSGTDPGQPTKLNPWGNYQQAFTHNWDVLTLQPNERRLLVDTDPMDRDSGQNQAEVPISLEFMKRLSANSPGAQVFIYSRPARRTDWGADGKPDGTAFSYASEWDNSYVDSGSSKNYNFITRSFVKQLMPLLRAAQKNDPATRNMKPVRLIPVAEAYYNVEQMIKAGKFAGTHVKSITDFYVDGSHPRGDTGSYLIACAFYASITGNDPRGIATPSSYLNPKPTSSDAKVRSLIQQAVYDAMNYVGYAGWTTPMPSAPKPPTVGAGSIRVAAFSDANHNGLREVTESAMSGVKAFIDADNDGKLDAGEKTGTSDSTGRITFTGLPVGTHRVRIIAAANTKVTTANPALVSVTANVTKVAHVGVTRLGSIAGRAFADDDKDGKQEAGEISLGARTIFIDLDNDSVWDSSERRTSTDSAGNFRFDGLIAGTYNVKRALPTGYRATTPPVKITLTAGQNFSGVMIGAAKA